MTEAQSSTTSNDCQIPAKNLRRRRQSSLHHLVWHVESDNLQTLVESFLSELGRRLEYLESYRQLQIDSGIEQAWSTLHAVHDSCSRVSGDILDVGRSKAKILVETLDESYRDALARKETLEQKVQQGMHMMESWLSDFEARAHDIKENGIGIQSLIEHGRKRVDSSIETAKFIVDEGIEMATIATESFEYAIEVALKKAREQGLLSVHDLPDPWQINEHILSGYRFEKTLGGCARSILGFHNEFFNIWSHVIGLVIVLSLAFYFYPTSEHFSMSTKTDVFIAGLFFFAACKCLVCSTIWHTFNSVAERHLIERFACVDYTGISVLIAASIMTTEYTAFYCEPGWRMFWLTMTGVLGVAGTLLPWNSTFNRYDMSWLRVTFYCGLAMTGAIPVIQLIAARGWGWTWFFYSPILKSLAVYFIGALLYANKLPERWFPGMFDYVGCSHNIWHVAVLAGILFHYFAMQEFFAKAFLRSFMQCSTY